MTKYDCPRSPSSEDNESLASGCSHRSSAHCHRDLESQMPEIDKIARRKLIIASILCLLFTIGEAVGKRQLLFRF